MTLPVYIGYQILARAKLKQLNFVYDFLGKFIMREHFSLILTDTDSIGLQTSRPSLQECVHPHLLTEYKNLIYGNCSDNVNPNAFLIRQCCKRHQVVDSRTPGIYKLEHGNNEVCIALSPKCYFLRSQSDECKLRAKGVKSPFISLPSPQEAFLRVMQTHQRQTCVNRGFRKIKQEMVTYEVQKIGLSFGYKKRLVLDTDNGIYTRAMDIVLNPFKDKFVCIVSQTPLLSPTCNLQAGWFKSGEFTFRSIMHAILVFKCYRTNEKQNEILTMNQIKNILELQTEDQLMRAYNTMESSELWESDLQELTEKFIRQRIHQNPCIGEIIDQVDKKPFIYATQYSSILGNGSTARVSAYHSASAFAGHNLIGVIYSKIRDERLSGKK